MGRIDDVLNIAGHRLGTMEIESALVAHPKVAEAAVVSKPHDIKGESAFAYVVLNVPRPQGAAAKILIDELRAWVGDQLSPSPSRMKFGSPTICRKRARAKSCAACCGRWLAARKSLKICRRWRIPRFSINCAAWSRLPPRRRQPLPKRHLSAPQRNPRQRQSKKPRDPLPRKPSVPPSPASAKASRAEQSLRRNVPSLPGRRRVQRGVRNSRAA